MEYKDEEEFIWIGRHWELQGEDSFEWDRFPPDEFKIIIMFEDGTVYSSQILEQYAYNSYFELDMRKAEKVGEGLWKVKAEKCYDYGNEILSFFLRMLATVVIEMLFLFILGYRERKSFTLVLITNIVTQLVLNLLVNLKAYYQGILNATVIYILAEFLVIDGETLVYGFFLKEKEVWRATLYGIFANILSFVIGLIILFTV